MTASRRATSVGPARPARRRGFTLLELLVAITIFSIMSGVAYRVLTSVLESRQRVEREHDKWRSIAIAFARLEQDIGAIRVRPVRDAGGLVAAPIVGVPVARANEANLALTRGGLADAQGTPGEPRRVGYRVREGALEQMVWPVLDQAPRTEAIVSRVLEGVDSLQVRYLDRTGLWQERWPTANVPRDALDDARQVVPLAIEVTLGLATGERIQRLFTPLAGGLR